MRRPPSLNQFPKYPVTAGTILLAIGATLAMWGGKDVDALYETVAIRRGEIWRMVTSALPHVNILHLAFNLYWTWVFGTLIEEMYGHLRTAAMFVFFAFVANGAEYVVLECGIGLSGVGYGLFGLLWALSRRDMRLFHVIDKNTITLFTTWFFVCIVLTIMGQPIANIAHGVGAGVGALTGYAITARGGQRSMAFGAMILLAGIVLTGATIARPWVNLSSTGGDEESQLGYELLMEDRNEEALRWLRDAVRMRGADKTTWTNYGIALDRLNRSDEAKAAYEKASQVGPPKREQRRLLEQIESFEREFK